MHAYGIWHFRESREPTRKEVNAFIFSSHKAGHSNILLLHILVGMQPVRVARAGNDGRSGGAQHA